MEILALEKAQLFIPRLKDVIGLCEVAGRSESAHIGVNGLYAIIGCPVLLVE